MLRKNKKEVMEVDKVQEILRTFPEFRKAYGNLKNRYINEIHFACDFLKLTGDRCSVFAKGEDGEIIKEKINDYYDLIACENFKMMIMERRDEDDYECDQCQEVCCRAKDGRDLARF